MCWSISVKKLTPHLFRAIWYWKNTLMGLRWRSARNYSIFRCFPTISWLFISNHEKLTWGGRDFRVCLQMNVVIPRSGYRQKKCSNWPPDDLGEILTWKLERRSPQGCFTRQKNLEVIGQQFGQHVLTKLWGYAKNDNFKQFSGWNLLLFRQK